MCVVKHKLVHTLFSDANVANAVLLRIRCAAICTIFSDANVANALLQSIICTVDLSPAFLLSSKRPPRDVIFYLYLDWSWAWWCNSCLDYSISTIYRLRLCSDATCLLLDKSISIANSILVLSLLAAQELREVVVSILIWTTTVTLWRLWFFFSILWDLYIHSLLFRFDIFRVHVLFGVVALVSAPAPASPYSCSYMWGIHINKVIHVYIIIQS